ncbi:hypothetical protein RIF29_26609 [Crotalaria pallida]|uniref:Uncharacterized protein n=1 Tax=Crotalaria pallida TaxID=3830 RepID=A0AAN9ENI1_CROPI
MFEPHIRFRDIKPEVDYVAFRARVIVLVRVPTMRRVHSSYNIHMVLMDPFGDEIHAAIYGPTISFFARYVHEGRVVCSAVMFVSKLLLNPNLPDVIEFRKRMLLSWIAHSPPIVAYAGSRCSIENQRLGDFPPVSLGILKNVNKAGYYTVICTIVGISNATRWYYHECSCKAILADISSQSSCPVCGVSVSRAVQS